MTREEDRVRAGAIMRASYRPNELEEQRALLDNIADALAQVRREAIEECAKEAENCVVVMHPIPKNDREHFRSVTASRYSIADAIRALGRGVKT